VATHERDVFLESTEQYMCEHAYMSSNSNFEKCVFQIAVSTNMCLHTCAD
jgi:hypothetical protein